MIEVILSARAAVSSEGSTRREGLFYANLCGRWKDLVPCSMLE